MNLFPPPSEKDDVFKTYLSQYKRASKSIDSGATSRTYNEQMRQIIGRFPYFDHTTSQVMAIAMVLATENDVSFDRRKASELVDIVFASTNTSKDKSMLIIDVARYYTRLTTHL
jgi:hypothetical protein